MASISRQPNGRRTVQFMAPDGKRRSIRLGKVTQRIAETVKLRVELLVAAKLTGHAIDDETARWLAGLDKTMTDKLAAVGLVPRREPASLTTVAGFLTEYVSRRVDVKPATNEVWWQIERNLLECYGAQRDLRTIDETAAEDFKLFLLKAEPCLDHDRQAAAIRPAVLQGGRQAEADSEQSVCRGCGEGNHERRPGAVHHAGGNRQAVGGLPEHRLAGDRRLCRGSAACGARAKC